MSTADQNDNYLDNLLTHVNALPLHRFLGLQVRRYGQGVASTSLVVGPNVLNTDGFVDHGAISTLAALACRFSLATVLGEGKVGITVDQHMTFVSPANSGRLVAKARVASLRARLGRLDVKVYDEEGELIASGGSTIYILPRDQYSSWRLARADWSDRA